MTEAEFIETLRKADAGDVDAMKLSTGYLLQFAKQFLEAGRRDLAQDFMARAEIYYQKATAADPSWIT